MGHGHDHGHATGRAEDRSRLRLVLLVTLSVVVIEAIGAWMSHSLALLTDAGHLVTDATAIILALSASYMATRPPTPRRTFGYHRAEILAALVNAFVLLGICGFLGYEAIRRLVHPATVDATQVLWFGALALAANLVSLWLLSSRQSESLNMRAAFLEVASDALGSFAALVAGAVILSTGFQRADPIASLTIAVLILPRSWSLIREALAVIMESAPAGVDVEEIRLHLRGVDGVVEVHDLHAWTITSGMPALSAHVTVTEKALAGRGVGVMLDDLAACTAAHFGIDHATFQIEPESHREHEHLGEQHH